MGRIHTVAAAAIAASLLIGCSQAPSDPPVAEAKAAAEPVSDRPADPIAASAYDFLDAVFAGDSSRADRQLTPAASREMAASGQRFAPPGAGPTGFKVGEVRKFSEERAAVECVVEGTVDGLSVEETLGCLLRNVGGEWLISGVAYEVSPDAPPTIIDFEKPATRPEPQYVADPIGPTPAAPRTAAGPTPVTVR